MRVNMTRDQNVLPQYLLSLPKVFLNLVLLLEAEVGVRSRFGNLCTLSLRKYWSGLAKWSEPALGDPAVGVPHVVAGQMDVLPRQRR